MRTILRQSLPLLAGLALAAAALAGCRPAPQPTPAPTPTLNLTDKAAAEATAIVQRAQATALVMRANATAAALTQVLPAESSAAQSAPAVATVTATRTPRPLPTVTPVAVSAERRGEAEKEEAEEAKAEGAAGAVELVGVGFAAEGGFIAVQFKAPKEISDKWMQGNVYVVDEATGAVYDDIPMMPILGPLLARPPRTDQLGYVMFKNLAGHGLKSGDLVTVVLGNFKQEHVKVM